MIICCGEALIDMLPRDAVGGGAAFVPTPGGAVFNTAIALGRLGAPVGFFTGLSTDLFGVMLQAALTAAGVDFSAAVVSDRPTTLAFVTLEDGQSDYAFYDENTAGRMLTAGDLPELPDACEALFFGGISLAVEPCGDTLATFCARQAGTRVIALDPNIRPGFIGDETAYRARLDAMISQADIVKFSIEDLAWFAAGSDRDDMARQILGRGPRLVLITEGAVGARAYTRDHQVFFPGRPAVVVDTVGAGDTFNAGVLAALHLHDKLNKEALDTLDEPTLRAALSLGVRAAAVTVGRAGANPPFVSEL